MIFPKLVFVCKYRTDHRHLKSGALFPRFHVWTKHQLPQRPQKKAHLLSPLLDVMGIVPVWCTTNDCPKSLCGIPSVAVCIVLGEILVQRSRIFPPIPIILVNHGAAMNIFKEPIPVAKE